MKKLTLLAVPASLVLMMFATPARADILFGASVGKADLEVDDLDIDDDDTGFKGYAGFRWFSVLGVEAQYTDLGTIEDGDSTVELQSTAIYVVGAFPFLGRWDIFAKVGYAHWEADVEVGSSSDDTDGEDFTYGVGVGVNFGEHIGIRAEYEVLEVEDTEDANFASIGLQIKL